MKKVQHWIARVAPELLVVYLFEYLIILISIVMVLPFAFDFQMVHDLTRAVTLWVTGPMAFIGLSAAMIICHGIRNNNLTTRSTGLFLAGLSFVMYASLQWLVRGDQAEWQSVVLFYGDAVAAFIRAAAGASIQDILTRSREGDSHGKLRL